jgi:hypothetical protein
MNKGKYNLINFKIRYIFNVFSYFNLCLQKAASLQVSPTKFFHKIINLNCAYLKIQLMTTILLRDGELLIRFNNLPTITAPYTKPQAFVVHFIAKSSEIWNKVAASYA